MLHLYAVGTFWAFDDQPGFDQSPPSMQMIQFIINLATTGTGGARSNWILVHNYLTA